MSRIVRVMTGVRQVGSWRLGVCVFALVWIALLVTGTDPFRRRAPPQRSPGAPPPAASPQRALLNQYCVACHNQRQRAAGATPIALDTLDVTKVGGDAESWEKVVLKLRAGLMPPAGRPRPDKATHDAFAAWLEGELDRAAAATAESRPHRSVPSTESRRVSERHPGSARPRRRRGLPPPGRRCQRGVRQYRQRDDDLADADGPLSRGRAEGRAAGGRHAGAAAERRLLPGHGRSPAGRPPAWHAVRHARRHAHPLYLSEGWRIRHPRQARARLERRDARVRRPAASGSESRWRSGCRCSRCRACSRPLREVSVRRRASSRRPGRRKRSRTLRRRNATPQQPRPPQPQRGAPPPAAGPRVPTAREQRNRADENWDVRVPVQAGQREVTVAFLKKSSAVDETVRLPFLRPYPAGNNVPESRMGAALRSVEISGPLAVGTTGETPSRRRIFVCRPPGAQRVGEPPKPRRRRHRARAHVTVARGRPRAPGRSCRRWRGAPTGGRSPTPISNRC